jgi:tetrachlorobenzoquinone reductase
MTLRARIRSATWEAPSIHTYELVPLDDDVLPPFAAGAHIDVNLANGMVRSYSLINSQDERHRYVIAVQKDGKSRGGSKWVHENFRLGDVIILGLPRNNFALNEDAEKSVLIAGGIGVTPFLSMIDRLGTISRDWELIYCARKRSAAAFLKRLEGRPKVRFNFDQEPGGEMLNLSDLVCTASPGTHFYCCGPPPMLEAFQTATKGLAPERVHLEYFTAAQGPARQGGFTVVLGRSEREIIVPPGRTLLEALLGEGVDVPHSCTEGMCGTCETKVLEGTPDHRDSVLTDLERSSNNTIMVCCSGSKSGRLVLDL